MASSSPVRVLSTDQTKRVDRAQQEPPFPLQIRMSLKSLSFRQKSTHMELFSAAWRSSHTVNQTHAPWFIYMSQPPI